MKLVEVVSGLQTDADVAAAIFELSRRWGKTPVHARSTPGFIVNRIARPYYAEALALLHERRRRAGDDRRLPARRRLSHGAVRADGPDRPRHQLRRHRSRCTTPTSATSAIAPSLVQREMVDGGLLGRKSGRGFFAYGAARARDARRRRRRSWRRRCPPARSSRCMAAASPSSAGRRGSRRPTCAFEADPVEPLERPADRRRRAPPRPTAAPATQVAADAGVRDLAVFDLPIAPARRRARRRRSRWRSRRPPRPRGASRPREWLRIAGWQPQPVGDAPGLVVARTVAMLINEGADAVQQGVCTPEGADLAMKLGVNHPAGPFEFLARWDARRGRDAARPPRRALPRRALSRQPLAARARLARASSIPPARKTVVPRRRRPMARPARATRLVRARRRCPQSGRRAAPFELARLRRQP